MHPELQKSVRIAWRRLPAISYNFGYNLLPSVFSVLVSWVVVRANGLSVWGQWVYIGSVVSFLALVAQFGIKDQLLRAFSVQPKSISKLWHEQVLLRTAPLLCVCLACFALIPGYGALCCLWIVLVWLIRLFEVFSIFEKKFVVLFASEIGFWCSYGALIYSRIDQITIFNLLIFNIIALSIRLCVVGVPALQQLQWPFPRAIRWHIPRSGLMFFILALVGLLEARTDIFCIKWMLGAESIGRYSLIFSFLLMLKNVPDFIVGPFLKNFYRSDKKVFARLGWQLGLGGIGVAIAGTFFFKSVFEWMYGLHYPWFFYGLAVLYVFPRFLFCMDIYYIFQQRKEYLMAGGICIGLLINALLDIWWLPTLGIESAMGAAAVGQWCMLFYFKWTVQKLQNEARQ